MNRNRDARIGKEARYCFPHDRWQCSFGQCAKLRKRRVSRCVRRAVKADLVMYRHFGFEDGPGFESKISRDYVDAFRSAA